MTTRNTIFKHDSTSISLDLFALGSRGHIAYTHLPIKRVIGSENKGVSGHLKIPERGVRNHD